MRLTYKSLLPSRSWTVSVFRTQFEVGDPEGRRWETVNALVDTGASFTWLPSELLRRLGVEPYDRRQFELANGSIIEREIGQTWLRALNQSAIRIVVFGHEREATLFGADAMEGLGLAADPVNQRLIAVRALAQ